MDLGDVNVTLYPAHCTSKHSAPGENNLDWIKETSIERNEDYHIGLAHGSVEGETIDSEGTYFLMKRDELESIPVDAWLIGHTHVPFPRNLTEEYTHTEKIFNAGTHVQTNVSCNTEGQCFVIEINDEKAVRAKKFVSGNVCFCRKHINLAAGKMEETLKDTLAVLSDDSVVDLVLSGAVTSEEYTNRISIMKNVLSRFLEGTYIDHELSRLITEDLVKAEFSETSFSAGLLNALLNEPKEAQLAYELLKSLKEGK